MAAALTDGRPLEHGRHVPHVGRTSALRRQHHRFVLLSTNGDSAASRCDRHRALPHRGLLFRFGWSVSSDAEKKVPTGGELLSLRLSAGWA